MGSATWYIDTDGKHSGPYSVEEVGKLVATGAIKPSTRLYDADSNIWKSAAEALPLLNLSSTESTLTGSRHWQVPQRPIELKDVHVVDLNTEHTGGVDYFALLHDQHRPAPVIRSSTPQQERRAGASGHLKLIEPKAAPLMHSSTSTIANSGTSIGSAVAQKAQPALRLVQSARSFMEANRTMISTAAALAFVFASTYGVIHTLAERKGREVAAAPADNDHNSPTATATPTAATYEDPFGKGKNKVRHFPGNLVPASAGQARMQPPPAQPKQATPAVNQEPPREPPQFFSTADPVPPEPVQPQFPQNPPEANSQPMPNQDPNSGLVQPPGFIPPQADNPNPDFNRAPTSTGQ